MEHAPESFEAGLLRLIPQLRIQALGLARNRSAAEDLVQDTLANALAARASFAPGTNLAGWLHRILRNRFISDRRRNRPATELDAAPEAALAAPAAQEHRLQVKELGRALAGLRPDQRAALALVAMQGLSYAEAAAATGCALGTAKSRVFRARLRLEESLAGRPPAPAARAAPARGPWPARRRGNGRAAGVPIPALGG